MNIDCTLENMIGFGIAIFIIGLGLGIRFSIWFLKQPLKGVDK